MDEVQGAVDNPCSRAAMASIFAEAVTPFVDAGVMAFDVASVMRSLASPYIFAGKTTHTPTVSIVIPTSAIPRATRGIGVS